MIRRPRRRMTISELKRAMDRRFDRVERTKVDKLEFRRAITGLRTELKQAMERRFDRLERTKVDKLEFRRAITSLRTGLRGEIATSAAETRRHFDVVAEAIRDDIRILAEALASHSDRLDKHGVRITALERRSM